MRRNCYTMGLWKNCKDVVALGSCHHGGINGSSIFSVIQANYQKTEMSQKVAISKMRVSNCKHCQVYKQPPFFGFFFYHSYKELVSFILYLFKKLYQIKKPSFRKAFLSSSWILIFFCFIESPEIVKNVFVPKQILTVHHFLPYLCLFPNNLSPSKAL